MGCPAGPMIQEDIHEAASRRRGRRGGRGRADLRPAVDARADVRGREVHPRLRLDVGTPPPRTDPFGARNHPFGQERDRRPRSDTLVTRLGVFRVAVDGGTWRNAKRSDRSGDRCHTHARRVGSGGWACHGAERVVAGAEFHSDLRCRRLRRLRPCRWPDVHISGVGGGVDAIQPRLGTYNFDFAFSGLTPGTDR